MNNIEKQIKRVTDWNKVRYDQNFDFKLAQSLLLEEIEELHTAERWPDILEGVGHITFVTVGILWKLRVDTDDIVRVFENTNKAKSLNQVDNIVDYYIGSLVTKYKFGRQEILFLKFALNTVFITCVIYLGRIGMQHTLIDILGIVCDSNETKSLPKSKVKANAKANTDKGDLYVPPTEALIQLIEGE